MLAGMDLEPDKSENALAEPRAKCLADWRQGWRATGPAALHITF